MHAGVSRLINNVWGFFQTFNHGIGVYQDSTFHDDLEVKGTLTAPSILQAAEEKTAAFTAVQGTEYLVDTTTGAITMTLPAAPTTGAPIIVYDAAKTFNTNALTVDRNGKLIDGVAANKTHAVKGSGLKYIFRNNTYGWLVKAFIFMLFALNIHAGDFTYEMNSWEQDSGLSIGTDKLKPRTAGGLLSISDSAGTTVATITTSAMTITTASITDFTLSTGTAYTIITTELGVLGKMVAVESELGTVDISTASIDYATILTLDSDVSQIGTLSLTTALTVPNGGTGLTTLAAGLIPYGADSSPWGSTANFTYAGNTLTLKESTTELAIDPNDGFAYGALIGTYSSHNVSFIVSGGIKMQINPEGEVAIGLGVTEAQRPLEVLTAMRATQGANAGSLIELVAADELTSLSSNFYTGDYRPLAFGVGGSSRMYVETNGNVGVGVAVPAKKLEVLDTAGAQARLSYTAASAYADFTVDAAGDLAITPSGTKTTFTTVAISGDYLASTGGAGITTNVTADGIVFQFTNGLLTAINP